MSAPGREKIKRRMVGENIWLGFGQESDRQQGIERYQAHDLKYEVLESEDAVGRSNSSS